MIDYLVRTDHDVTDFSLYDMDLVFDPPGSGMFNEVYLYEELMEADLHAIVSCRRCLVVTLEHIS